MFIGRAPDWLARRAFRRREIDARHGPPVAPSSPSERDGSRAILDKSKLAPIDEAKSVLLMGFHRSCTRSLSKRRD